MFFQFFKHSLDSYSRSYATPSSDSPLKADILEYVQQAPNRTVQMGGNRIVDGESPRGDWATSKKSLQLGAD